jgi:hypothetical protein
MELVVKYGENNSSQNRLLKTCLAVKYAFEILGLNKITLGVFVNNPAVHTSYKVVDLADLKYHEDAFTFKVNHG